MPLKYVPLFSRLYEDLAWAGLVLRDILDFESTAFRGEKEGFLELGVRGRHTGGFIAAENS